MRALTPIPIAGLDKWRPAQVPGVVQTELLRQKLVPDPFYGRNEFDLQWIGLADWEYRTTFDVTAETLRREHLELVFDGLDTYAEVFLNESPVLSADNMFRQWRLPVKSGIKAGANTLRVVFRSPVTKMLPVVEKLPYVLPSISTLNCCNERGIATAPYTRKAPYQYGWDWGPRFLTIGIWKPVRLEAWDSVRIRDLHIRQQRITKETASLVAELEVEAGKETSATVSISYDAKAKPITESVLLDPGVNKLSIPIRIASPRLWYPAGYGAQERYTFAASIKTQADETTTTASTGLRSLELQRVADQWGKNFAFIVNGIPIFAKGANIIPFDSFPDRVTPDWQRRILTAARDANMNMLRTWGGAYYESDDFYEIADELGIMIWQDFMFGGDMVPGDPEFQENVRHEAIYQVKRLRNHPSVVLWCGNNEVETGWRYWGDRQAFKQTITAEQRDRVWQDYVVMFRDILKGVVAEHGGGVPYWPSSPGSNFDPVPPGQENGDAHYWMVWHALEPIQEYTKQFPRFMSEFGFQSFPEMRTIRSFAPPEQFDLRSPIMQAHQKNRGGNERILAYMLREYFEPKDFESFVYLSQIQQAEAIRTGAEHLRRNRPRIMGSLYWQLNDCWPVASWSSIDYYGRWKALHYAARRFYNDVLVSPFIEDGKANVYLLSDRTQPITAKLRTRLMSFTGRVLWETAKDVQVTPLSSNVALSVDIRDLQARGENRQSFLAVELTSGNEVLSRNTLFFDRMRELPLPDDPRITADLERSGDAYRLTLKSPSLARHVYVSFGDHDVTLGDNYIDLLPGEAVKLSVRSAASLEDLRKAMKVTHLMQAFHPAATSQVSAAR